MIGQHKASKLIQIEIPEELQHQVEMFLHLFETRQIRSLSQLKRKDDVYLRYDIFKYSELCGDETDDDLPTDDRYLDRFWTLSLDEIWQKVAKNIEDAAVRAIACSQCRLIEFDCTETDCPVILANTEIAKRVLLRKKDFLVRAFKQGLGVDVGEIEIVSPPEDESKVSPSGAVLTEDQSEALDKLKQFTLDREPLFRLQGFAGTGKSFLICEYIKWLNTQNIPLLAACPTNKAAKNLRQIAESAKLDLEVKTVAQLLGQQPELNEDTGKETFESIGENCIGNFKVVIIDEFSMINRENFTEIRDEARIHGTKIIFIGDSAQLPPVKEKEPMAAKYPMPEAQLSKIVRYDGDIVRIAEAIRKGRTGKVLPKFTTQPDKTIVCLSQKEWLKRAFELFESEEFSEDADYVRLLAWRNKTVKELNRAVRLHLWGESANPYIPGDRLIALKPLFRPQPGAKGKNKWKVFVNNSEEAIVTSKGILSELTFNREQYQYWEVMVRPDVGQEAKLMILHEDSVSLHAEMVKHYAKQKQWSSYFDLSRMFDNVGYAYALTCHKAQGSTIEHVFLDAVDMRSSCDRQKLLYTALTRTRKQAFILE